MELYSVDGITRAEAHANYMRALSELVTYVWAVDHMTMEMFARPEYDAYQYARCRRPTPEAISAVVAFQAAEHVRANPPTVRTIELVSA